MPRRKFDTTQRGISDTHTDAPIATSICENKLVYAERIRTLRAAANLSQGELADVYSEDRRAMGSALAALRAALGEAFGTGMTCIPAQGGFSHEEMTIVYFVVNRFQISRMKDIVHDLDDRAYITISEVADVFKLNQDKLTQKVDNQPLLPRRK